MRMICRRERRQCAMFATAFALDSGLWTLDWTVFYEGRVGSARYRTARGSSPPSSMVVLFVSACSLVLRVLAPIADAL